VNVNLSGEGQPSGFATTDSKGRFSFKVCEGQVQIFASSQNGYAQAAAEAGDTNVVIQLSQNGSMNRSSPTRAALTGKPLPDLTVLGLNPEAVAAGKPVLVCLLDVGQRPSRRVARLLSEQYDALKQKGVTVVAIQAAATTEESFKAWKDGSAVPFPVGRVMEKSEKTRWAAAAEALPWLILADADHRVTAEGFALDDLDAKLQPAAR
jgi:hypothetical protein